jgi:NADPH:quinone reductase-like Zn-dependent oxidoreductase
MKALIHKKYGSPDLLEFVELEKPAPKDDEVLVKIHAASVNALDWHLLTADIFLVRLMGQGLFRPKDTSIGADIAGRVEAVGPGATLFKPGDEVYGDIAGSGQSGFAEYCCVREKRLALKPANLSFEQAAAVPVAGLTALQGLRDKGLIKPGQKVLIQGASGGVGTFAVQIAKYYEAEVTAVTSTGNVEQARAMGADHVIDYKKEDFTKSGKQYDLILAANGHHPLSAYKRALTPTGIYVMAGGTAAQIFQAVLLGSFYSEKEGRQFVNVSAHQSQEDLNILRGMLESGKVVPVIDRTYPLNEAAEAVRYLGTGHARGKVIIKMD